MLAPGMTYAQPNPVLDADAIPADEATVDGGFFRQAGRAVGRAAVAVGRGAKAAYLSVDPDVRKHVAQLPLVGLTMLAPARREPTPLPDDGHRPIVFVHGMGGGPGNFTPLQVYLHLHGWRRCYAVKLDADDTVEAMASRVADFVDEVARANGLGDGAQVDLVAHSMGGIVARVALDDPRLAGRVGVLVTLGAPHAGTWLARYASTSNTRSMRPRSDLVQRLEAQLPWPGPPGRPRLVALWSENDMVLLPPGSACVEGAQNIEMPGFSHYGYLIHVTGFRHVRDALRDHIGS